VALSIFKFILFGFRNTIK